MARANKEKKATNERAKRTRLKKAKPPEKSKVAVRARPKPYLRVPLPHIPNLPDPALPNAEDPPPPEQPPDLPKAETIFRDHLYHQSQRSSWYVKVKFLPFVRTEHDKEALENTLKIFNLT